MINYFINNKKFLVSIVVNAFLVILVFFHGQIYGWHAINDIRLSNCADKYELVNKDAVCGKKPVITKTGYAIVQDKINAFIEEGRTAGRVSNVSVYFRDLENGPIFGINETDDFTPASLLKLPLSMFYIITAEKDPELLSQKLSFSSSDETFVQLYNPSETIISGQSYTIEELLRRMLAYSDNNAYELLGAHLEANGQDHLVREAYLEMGLISEGDRYTMDLSVRRYASIFRALYNASYVNPELSEKALGWLVQSDFKNGLTNGLPANIRVAHKFGERTSPDGMKQLHDCGIVYYPQNPYLLCIMTRGKDFKDLEKMISQIAKEIYEEVDSRRIKE